MEELKNIRRMAERGLMRAQQPPMHSAFIDMFQHILDKCVEVEKEIKDLEEYKFMYQSCSK